MDLSLRMVQQRHQDRNPVQLTDLLLDPVILITQVLQIGSRVGLDGIQRVAEHWDHFMQVGVSPARVSSNAVQAHHAAAFVGNLQSLCAAHGLEERVQGSFQLGHEGLIIATPEETYSLDQEIDLALSYRWFSFHTKQHFCCHRASLRIYYCLEGSNICKSHLRNLQGPKNMKLSISVYFKSVWSTAWKAGDFKACCFIVGTMKTD